MDPCLLPTNWASCAGEKITQGATHDFAESMTDGFDKVLKEFATSWIGQGILIDLDGASVEWFKYSMSVVTVFLAVLGLMIAGARVAYLHRGEAFQQIMHALGRVLFVTTAGTFAVQTLIVGGDAFGTWILQAAGLDATTFGVVVGTTAIAPGLAIVFGLFGIIAVLCQWGIMLVRGALLPLLIGFWPTAAAGAMTKGGEGAFDVVTKWILAFVIYSPLAACIYAFAWRLKSGGDGIGGVVNSLILIILAVVALPALMRLLGPVASALGKATGGAMAMGITSTAVAAGVAVGATVATAGAAGAVAGAGAGSAAASGNGAAAASSSGPAAQAGSTGAGPGAASEGSAGAGSSSAGSTGTDSGGLTAGGTEAPSGGPGASTAGGSSGASEAAWRAAGAATDQASNNDSSGTAEGMVAE